MSPTSKTKKNKATIQKPKLDYCLIFVYILFISIILGILLIVKNNILFGFSLSIISFVLKFITYKEKGIYSNFTLDWDKFFLLWKYFQVENVSSLFKITIK